MSNLLSMPKERLRDIFYHLNKDLCLLSVLLVWIYLIRPLYNTPKEARQSVKF